MSLCRDDPGDGGLDTGWRSQLILQLMIGPSTSYLWYRTPSLRQSKVVSGGVEFVEVAVIVCARRSISRNVSCPRFILKLRTTTPPIEPVLFIEPSNNQPQSSIPFHLLIPHDIRHGRWSRQLPRPQSQILPSSSSPSQPCRLPYRTRINTDNMAQGKGGTASGRKAYHARQKEHRGEQEKSDVNILCEYT